MISNYSFKAVDLSVLGISGFLMLLGLLAAILAVPWNIKRWRHSGALQLNVLWPSRVFLAITVIFWMACQTLRLDTIWGSNAILLPTSASQWSGRGWLCRIYLTTTLGITAPLTAFLTIHILATGVKRQKLGELELANTTQRQTKTNVKLVVAAMVCTLPITLAQVAIAWVSVWVKEDNGASFESQPRSLLAYFLATFWYANQPQGQCTVPIYLPTNAIENREGDIIVENPNCTMCYFPAAAVIFHAVWNLGFLIGIWTLYKKLTKKAVNTTIARRLFFFCSIVTGFVISGVAALGASIAFDPFGWVNQGLWIGYALTAAGTAFVTIVFMILIPSATLRYVSWNMQKYNDKLFSTDTTTSFTATNNNTNRGLTYLHHPSPSSPCSPWVHIHSSSNSHSKDKPFPGTPYDSALSLSTSSNNTVSSSRKIKTLMSGGNSSRRITPLPPSASSDYVTGSVVDTVDSTAASYPTSLFPQPPTSPIDGNTFLTQGSLTVTAGVSNPRQFSWSQQRSNQSEQIDSGHHGSGLLRSNTYLQQQYQQPMAVPTRTSTTSTQSYWSAQSHSAESPASSMYGSGMKSPSRPTTTTTTAISPEYQPQYQQQYQYPQRPAHGQPYSSHFRVQSQSSPYRARSGHTSPGSPVPLSRGAVLPVSSSSTRPYSASGGFVPSSSNGVTRPNTASVVVAPNSLAYHQYRNAAPESGPFSHPLSSSSPHRSTTTSNQHHQHHQRVTSSHVHSGGVTQLSLHQQPVVVDTNPITNPLWFQSGLPPSYHHSPTSSIGS